MDAASARGYHPTVSATHWYANDLPSNHRMVTECE